MNKQDAIARLDALDKKSDALESTRRELAEESKKLRAIIEAEPKKEPRGLCWVARGVFTRRVRRICGTIGNGQYYDDVGDVFDTAIPLTDSELQEYRGRWE